VTHIPATVPPESFSGILDAQAHNSVLDMYVRPGEWCVMADLDEFMIVPGMTLREAASGASRDGANHIAGYVYDRITEDGSIPTELEDDIWKQFPVSTNATHAICGGCINKAAIIRGDTRVSGGCHTLITQPLQPWPKHLASVYHFKWWSNDPTFFVRRWKEAQESGHPYAHEKKILVDYLDENNGRIDLSKLEILETQNG
jgi:hypothetical protein